MVTVSIVVSFFNEASTLPKFMHNVFRVFEQRLESYEIIFVNDNSTDDSASVIALQAKVKPQNASVVTINMSRRFGVEECFLAGIERAKGDAIILMYADLQDPPDLIPDMLEQYYQGAQVVHTIRRSRIGDPWLKRIVAHFAYRLVNRSAQVPIPLDAGDFKLLSRKVARIVLSLSESDPYLRGLIPWVGFKQTSVCYDMQPRQGGNSKIPLFGTKAWTVFLSGVTSFSHFPIPLMLTVGVLTLIFSAVGCLVYICKSQVGGWGFMLSYITLLWSLLVMMLAFLGIYLLRIYKDVRGRPKYIIDDVVQS